MTGAFGRSGDEPAVLQRCPRWFKLLKNTKASEQGDLPDASIASVNSMGC